MKKTCRILVAGQSGMVGSAIVRKLERNGYENIVRYDRNHVNFLDQEKTYDLISTVRPDFVFVCAARVGGIEANNTYRGNFIFENLQMQLNLIEGARRANVRRLMFLGSSCIYPRNCPQPIKESYLLSGPLEVTNEPYAIAKIAGIKLAEAYSSQYGLNYFSVMPTNLYGPNDNYDLMGSHVVPALLRKAHEAKINCCKSMLVWGSGAVRREFLYVDDLADGCVFLMENEYCGSPVNIGTGLDVTISELAALVAQTVGFRGSIEFDPSMPDGTPRKLLDISRMTSMGWTAQVKLADGILRTYSTAPFFN